MVILADCAHCRVLGEGLTGFDWRIFLVSVRADVKLLVCTEMRVLLRDEGGLTLSSGKFRSVGSTVVTIVR